MSSNSWRPGKRVAIAGGGSGSISTGLAFLKRGYDVRIYERQAKCKAIGNAVLLSTPVLAILRSYGIDLDNLGWHYGVLRSSVFKNMPELVPDGVIYANHEVASYMELEEGVEIKFKAGNKVTADILIGADGIRSNVSRQAFGDPKLFHTGIRLWLAWCDHIPGIEPNYGVISHDWKHHASFFPMRHDGKPGFKWWVVEPSWDNKPDWAQPRPRFLDATDFNTQVFRWEIYNRPSMKSWSSGRIACVEDAVHPVSPYAAYGMGMAIEDCYYLAKTLDGLYEKQRFDYVNHNMKFARFLGSLFHGLPWPLAKLRDIIFDYTPVLKAEKETMSLKELQVV
ncbi:hypothetical protein BDW59DRAFT_180776 [Aspergillus cavernicola]|uniref:FAD-binding domain-containing protein n=1 Tax=Aspergillus cavernicola TaxID=176166 RepID=A0ABR4I8I4_9EURO